MEISDELLIFGLRLDEAGLEYMITGGLATVLYGNPRLTNDIDLVLHISTAQVSKLPSIFAAPEFYCPPIEVMRLETTREAGGHFNIIHTMTSLKADIYPLSRAAFERDAFRRRERLAYLDYEVWVAPPDYVIARKLEYYREGGSEKHLGDIRGILANSGGQLDRERLLDNLAALGLLDLWRDLFGST